MFWHVLIKKLMTVSIREVLALAVFDEGETFLVYLVDDTFLISMEVLAYQLDIRVYCEGDLLADVVRGTQQAQGGHFIVKELE